MSRPRKTLLAVMLIATLSSAGCASRAELKTSSDKTCGRLEACQKNDETALHGYGRLSTPLGGDRDLSLPPPSLTTVEALEQSSDVKAALARSAAAYSEIAAARSMTRPQASFDATGSLLSVHRDPVSGDEPNKSYSYALTVNLPLYQGGRDKAALGVALSEFRASVESAKDVLISTSLSLVSAQAQVRRQDQALVILQKHRKALKALRGNVAGERDAGVATAVDIGDVDRQLLRLDVEQKQALLQRTEAQQTIVRLNASATLKANTLASSIAARLPDDFSQLVDLALKNNPRIAARFAGMDAAQARVDQAKSAYNPNLSLALSTAVEGNHSNSTDLYKEGKAVLRFSVPLYSGGAREAGIQGRHADLLASAMDKDSAVMGVYAAVKTAFDRQNYARQMLALAQNEVALSHAQIQNVKAERKLGERSVFDEIRAISDAASAEMDVNSAVYELDVSQFILASETGLLDDIIGAKLDLADEARQTAKLVMHG